MIDKIAWSLLKN